MEYQMNSIEVKLGSIERTPTRAVSKPVSRKVSIPITNTTRNTSFPIMNIPRTASDLVTHELVATDSRMDQHRATATSSQFDKDAKPKVIMQVLVYNF